MPLVSVVIATYNRAGSIQRAIRNVQNQTFQEWELIVIDDGSSHHTPSLIQELREGHLSCTASLQKCICNMLPHSA